MHTSLVVTELRKCSVDLTVLGAEIPTWSDLRTGVQPEHDFEVDQEPGVFKYGWQQKIAKCVESNFKNHIWVDFSNTERAHIR